MHQAIHIKKYKIHDTNHRKQNSQHKTKNTKTQKITNNKQHTTLIT